MERKKLNQSIKKRETFIAEDSKQANLMVTVFINGQKVENTKDNIKKD